MPAANEAIQQEAGPAALAVCRTGPAADGADAAARLEAFAREVEQAQGETKSASETADAVVLNVRMVDAMMGQIHQGTQAVSSCTDESTAAADAVRAAVESTAAQIEQLAGLGKEIGSFVGVISRIADQTRFLSLNARLEAARAGEHGRGFAVVADAVKGLSSDTVTAVDEVVRRIEGINEATAAVARSMRETQERLIRIHGLVERIAAAVAEQRGIAEGVRTYVNEAADSVEGIGKNISRANQELTAAMARARGLEAEP